MGIWLWCSFANRWKKERLKKLKNKVKIFKELKEIIFMKQDKLSGLN